MKQHDVVIVGAGIAGSFLARHLKLMRPELSVLVLEAQATIDDYKVGESTVEVAANYMVRRLGLGTYLYQHQLPKNGLRFFFDSEKKDLPLTRMSEIGSDHMPFHPSFQLERAALERDLTAMNRAIGATVELGAKVVELSVSAGKSPHVVTYEQGGARASVGCRWLCDASGRRHLLHRKLGLPVHRETRLDTGAAWGRYRNVAGLDAVNDPEFRSRVRYTSRHLSTNHFMYDGYWLWFIPLAGDLMSVGAVFDRDRVAGPRTREELEAFMRSHRAAGELMQGAVFEDFQAYAHLPYHADQFFSKDRWAVTGEAGAFADPFYSPGSDFIATSNELIAALIEADLSGDQAGLEEKAEAYNAFYRFKYESTLLLYARLYPVFGSYEVFRLKYLLDFHNYYNLVVWPFMADRLTDVAWIREELAFSGRVTQALSQMADHFCKMAEHLRARGEYHAQNEGRFANGLCGVGQLEGRLGPVIDEAFRREEVGRAFGHVLASVLERVMGQEGLSRRARFLAELGFQQVVFFRGLERASYDKVLQRIGSKMARELGAEAGGEGALRVVFEDTPGGAQPRVVRAAGAVEPRVQARAQALWDAEATSLTGAQM